MAFIAPDIATPLNWGNRLCGFTRIAVWKTAIGDQLRSSLARTRMVSKQESARCQQSGGLLAPGPPANLQSGGLTGSRAGSQRPVARSRQHALTDAAHWPDRKPCPHWRITSARPAPTRCGALLAFSLACFQSCLLSVLLAFSLGGAGSMRERIRALSASPFGGTITQEQSPNKNNRPKTIARTTACRDQRPGRIRDRVK